MTKVRLSIRLDSEAKELLKKYIPNISAAVNKVAYDCIEIDKSFQERLTKRCDNWYKAPEAICHSCKKRTKPDDHIFKRFTSQARREFPEFIRLQKLNERKEGLNEEYPLSKCMQFMYDRGKEGHYVPIGCIRCVKKDKKTTFEFLKSFNDCCYHGKEPIKIFNFFSIATIIKRDLKNDIHEEINHKFGDIQAYANHTAYNGQYTNKT